MLQRGYSTRAVIVRITESRLATRAGLGVDPTANPGAWQMKWGDPKSLGPKATVPRRMSEMQSPKIIENAIQPIAACQRSRSFTHHTVSLR